MLHKLAFYAAQVATCPPGVLRTVAEELHHLFASSEAIEPGEAEAILGQGFMLPFDLAPGAVDMGIVSGPKPARHRNQPSIEELN